MTNLEPCPRCRSVGTCEITCGCPTDEEQYLKLVAERKIFPGGFTVKSDSPKRCCNNCQNRWGLANLEKTDFIILKSPFRQFLFLLKHKNRDWGVQW